MKHYIEINGNNYPYAISPNSDSLTSRVICKSACIDDDFLNGDIPSLLKDLKNLILAEQKYQNSMNVIIRFRATKRDKDTILKNVSKYGYKNMSEFLKIVSTKPELIIK